jgi:hypothetical protein
MTPRTDEGESDEGDTLAFSDENPFAGEEPDWFEPEPGASPAKPVLGVAPHHEGPGSNEEVPAAQESLDLPLDFPQVAPPAVAPLAEPPEVSGASPESVGGLQAEVETGSGSSPSVPDLTVAGSEHPNNVVTSRRKTVRINFQRSRSLEGDRKRLNDLIELLGSYEGEDRFEIILLANGKARYQLEFPNNTTRVCRDLKAELMQRLGAGGWSVNES